MYRTEWTVYAVREDIAGSIDCVMKLPDRTLALIDWKRTKCLAEKHQAFGKTMRDPLNSVPDAVLWHYRLQLNMYRYILETYYDQIVSQMLVVGCHPDNGAFPFVDRVPCMKSEIEYLMQSVRVSRESADLQGGSFSETGSHLCHASPLSFCLLGLRAAGWKHDTAADSILFQSLFCKPCAGPHAHHRIWKQLEEFHKTASPCSHLLARFPSLFWILPAPFETTMPRIEWRYQLEVARMFLHLIQNGQVLQLECGMIAFFWPEIQADPSLLDIVSTAKSSTSRRDRIKRLVSALLCLHILSLPSLHVPCRTPVVSPPAHPKRMPTYIFYRYMVLYHALSADIWEGQKGQKTKKKVLGIHFCMASDKRGGASQEMPFEERVDGDIGREMEAKSRLQQVEANEGLDICGGASQEEMSFDDRVAAEQSEMDPEVAQDLRMMDSEVTKEMEAEQALAEESEAPPTYQEEAALPPPPVEATPAKEEHADDEEDPVFGEEISESTWNILKKRRLLPGALTSHEDFANLFQSFADANEDFQIQPGEPIENPDTILYVVQKRQEDIARQYPRFSKHIVRMATAAQAVFCMRVADMSLREHALMLWIIEGIDFLGFHDGDCYMLHPCGAFQRYKGVPPDSSRISDFLLQLEGLFRRLPEI